MPAPIERRSIGEYLRLPEGGQSRAHRIRSGLLIKTLLAKIAKRAGYTVVRNETFNRLLVQEPTPARLEPASPEPASPRPPDSSVSISLGSPLDLPAPFATALDESFSADHFFRLGEDARKAGDDAAAFAYFARANSLIYRHGPTAQALMAMSNECYQASILATEYDKLPLLVRTLEMNPGNTDARAALAKATDSAQGVDLTKTCFVFYDAERARAIHQEAYRRALEFVTLGGVAGDIMEFGVLGGWSARIFCETMRDVFNLNNIRLFDSFEGLPEYESEIDRLSYEIAGRNIWSDKMKFPDEFLRQFGQPHHLHIKEKLAEIVRSERIFVHKGFYSETLKAPPRAKASIVHFDCDLYQSTVEVFNGLNNGSCLQDGTVLLFDDWNCNRANPNFGQRRALQEFLSCQRNFTATPWYTYGFNGAAYILHAA
jgi:O-methyltransferase